MRWPAGGLACGLTLALQAGVAAALPLEPNTSFRLGNHPDGSGAPPFYGLRLDALGLGDDDRDEDDDEDGDDLDAFVFDFGFCAPQAVGCQVTSEAVAKGAFMAMDYLADGSLHIHGKAWGGPVDDHEFEDALLWAIDFRYSALSFDADAGIQFAEEGSGSGTLTALEKRGDFRKDQVIELSDFAGRLPFSFALANGIRGFSGLSGVGGLALDGFEDGEEHVEASGWLFTATVPEPATFLLAALGLLMLARLGQRRRRAPGGRTGRAVEGR